MRTLPAIITMTNLRATYNLKWYLHWTDRLQTKLIFIRKILTLKCNTNNIILMTLPFTTTSKSIYTCSLYGPHMANKLEKKDLAAIKYFYAKQSGNSNRLRNPCTMSCFEKYSIGIFLALSRTWSHTLKPTRNPIQHQKIQLWPKN